MIGPRFAGVIAIAVALATAAPASIASAQTRADTSRFRVLQASAPVPVPLATMIDIDADRRPLVSVLEEIAQRAGVGFTYDRALPGLTRAVSLHARRMPAAEALLRVLDGGALVARVSTAGHIVLVKRTSQARRLRGVVRTVAGGPASGVRLELTDTHGVAWSADDGAFTFARVEPGTHSLRATRLGFRPLVTPVIVSSDDDGEGDAPVVITLDAVPLPLQAVVVTPAYFGIMAQHVEAPQTLDREQIRTRPQIGEDLFRSINRLPGLSSSDFTAGFHVRGAEIDELLVSFDGLELYEPFHLKDIDGALSIMDVESVEGVDLTTGGFTAEYGGRLGGVLAIRSAEPRRERARTTIGLSVTNLRLQSTGGFGAGRGAWVVAARRGYLDLALRLSNNIDSISPRYADLFAKVSFDVNARHRVAAHLLLADDGLTYTDDGMIRSGYGSNYGWVTWDAQPGARLTASTVLSAGALSWRRDGWQVSGNEPSEAHERRRFRFGGLRQDWTFAPTARTVVRWGADVRPMDASYDYAGVRRSIGVVGDSVVDLEQPVQVALDPAGTQIGLYVAPRVRPTSWLVTEIGVRYERASSGGAGEVSPRANAALALGSRTTVRLATGRYVQPQPLYALQVQDGADQFGSVSSAVHRVVGLEQRLGATTLRVEAYERRVTSAPPRYINLVTKTRVFPELEADRVLRDAATGRARGLELMARHVAADGLDWSLSYARAQVTDDLAGGPTIPRTYDQRHTMYSDASYHPAGRSWRLSASWQVHSGWPEAPVTFTLDTVRGRGTFVQGHFGPLAAFGDGRIPWYHRVDIRFTRVVQTTRGRVSFFADVFNLFDSANPRGFEYEPSFPNGRLSVRRVPDPQIGRFPSAGIAWEF